MTPPTLETPRLILRAPEHSDLDRWAMFMEDPEASKFLGGPQPRSVVWNTMATIAGSWAVRGFGLFSVIERRTGRWIGRVGPWQPRGWTAPEIGWALAKDVWRQGYGLEAATAAIEWTVSAGLIRQHIVHAINPKAAASIALARRLGAAFQRVGPRSPYGPQRLGLWGQTVDQWRACHRVNQPLSSWGHPDLQETSRRREPPEGSFD